MKTKYHFVWICTIFALIVAPLFYVLYCLGYLPNREWNNSANATECLVIRDKIVDVVCHSGGTRWGRFHYEKDPLACFNGIVTLRHYGATKNFVVAYGSYDLVNDTLHDLFPKGKYVDCVAQINNTSDFELHFRPVELELTMAFAIPGCILLILIAWGVCVLCAKKKDYFQIQYS